MLILYRHIKGAMLFTAWLPFVLKKTLKSSGSFKIQGYVKRVREDVFYGKFE